MSKIRKCSVPFLFISGLADNLVPPNMMRTLYTECGSQRKGILVFPGGSHNDTWIVDGYEFFSILNNELFPCLDQEHGTLGKNIICALYRLTASLTLLTICINFFFAFCQDFEITHYRLPYRS